VLGTAALRAKSPEAFRTISEVATDLDVPQHVLRFWEARFAQIKPVKRAGGRRYYRPEDVDLLRGIRTLLYDDGFTIKGAQKVLRDKGTRYVAGLGRGEAGSVPLLRVIEPRSNVIALERLSELVREPIADSVAPAEDDVAAPAADDVPMTAAPAAEPSVALEPEPAAAGLAEEERVRLEILLAELQQLKARLARTAASFGSRT
jgi:DNA-binding transcriptional MerR regulator